MTVTKKLIGRLPILIGEYDSNKAYNKKQRVTLYGSEFESIVDNNTTAPATLSDNNLIINTDNWRVVSNGTEAFLAGEKVKYFNEEDNPEFLEAKVDSNKKLLESTDIEGNKTFYKDINVNGKIYSKDIEEKNTAIKNDIIDVYRKSNVHTTDDSIVNTSSIVSISENPEYINAILDDKDKMVAGHDTNGVLHEFVGINTPFIKTDSVDVNDIKVNGLYKYSEVYLERPKFATIYLNKSIPNRNVNCSININNTEVLRCLADISIQGHGSASYNKKGYTFDFKNADGEKLKIKFGNMPALDSYHVKAFATDMTHSRNIGNMNLWRALIANLKYPDCYINNKALNLNKIEPYADARYAEDGFPVTIYIDNAFFGLYTLKTKKSMENYAINKSDGNNIFLDSITYDANLYEAFEYKDWELKSPKLEGYNEGWDISKYNSKDGSILGTDILQKIESLWSFLTTLSSDNKANASEHIVVSHWLVWKILSELIGNYDTGGNNMELVTWDGIHWSIIPYDTDLTIGLNAWGGYAILTSQTGYIADSRFFKTLRTVFEPEIKELYSQFRKSKVIDITTIMKYYKNQVEAIPRSAYEQDYKKWGTIWHDNNGNNQIPNMKQIESYLKSRINYLDSVWYNN